MKGNSVQLPSGGESGAQTVSVSTGVCCLRRKSVTGKLGRQDNIRRKLFPNVQARIPTMCERKTPAVLCWMFSKGVRIRSHP